MPQGCSATRDPHRGPTQRGPTQGTHTEDPYKGPTQGTHTEGRAPQRTHHRRGGPHRGPTQNTHRRFTLEHATRDQDDKVPRPLAFTRYSFAYKLLCTNQPSYHFPRPPALPTLVQYYCTTIGQYTTPLPTCRLYTIHHTRLVITISYEGQHPLPPSPLPTFL